MFNSARMMLVCAALTSAFAGSAWAAGDATGRAGAARGGYDYPTQGRVEYVLTCLDENGHDFANVYKCSCVIDKMAAVLPYDEFVGQQTFARYATLGGQGGAEFRVDHAKDESKAFRTLKANAYRACGLTGALTATK